MNTSLPVLACLCLALASVGARANDPEPVAEARAELAAAEAGRDEQPLAEAVALERLAAALVRARQGGEVGALLERALAIREREQGGQHIDLAATLRQLASALSAQREYGQADDHLTRAVAILSALPGEDHPELARALYELGTARYFDRRPAAAIEPLARAAAIQGREKSWAAYSLPRTIERLANAHLALDDPAAAIAVLEPWLEPLASELGETLAIAEMLAILGRAYRGVGKVEEADALFERRLSTFVSRLGEQDELVMGELRGEAIQALMDGRHARAEALYGRQLELLEGRAVVPPLELAGILRALSLAIPTGERIGESEALAARALAIARDALGAGDPKLAHYLTALAEKTGAAGRHDAAIALYEEALPLLASDPELQPRALAEAEAALLSLRDEQRAARLGPQPLPARFAREGIVYDSHPLLPERFDMEVIRTDRAHVEHAGQRIALWNLAAHARDLGATSLLVRNMADDDLCGGILLIEHGLPVFFDHGEGRVAGMQFNFTEPDSVRKVWQICRIRLAPDPD